MKVRLNDKPILLTDREAILLVKRRALAERRSAAGTAALTLIESLGPAYGGDGNTARPGRQAGTPRIHQGAES